MYFLHETSPACASFFTEKDHYLRSEYGDDADQKNGRNGEQGVRCDDDVQRGEGVAKEHDVTKPKDEPAQENQFRKTSAMVSIN